jgi:uncharacterized protein YjiS (DUF1127 family)
LSASLRRLRGWGERKFTMSNTTPLSPRAPLQAQMSALPWAALVAACQNLLADWRDRRQIRATRLALMNLDDQTLRDIGFVRAEINSVAAESHGGVSATRDRLLARGTPPGL